jgi:hypothetical protein
LTDDLAGLAASGVNRQPKYFGWLLVRHPIRQIARMNEHVAPTNSKTMIMGAET